MFHLSTLMKDNEDTIKANKHRVPKYFSMIDEIRAQDIYTLHSADTCPTLPSVITSCYESLGCGTLVNRERALSKSRKGCRRIMKKLSIHQLKQSSLSLPALIEEDNTYLPSVPLCSFVQPIEHDRFSTNTTIYSATQCTDDLIANCAQSYEDTDYEDSVDDELSEYEDDGILEGFEDDESWVDLSKHTQFPPAPSLVSQSFSSAMPLPPTSPDRVTPLPFGNGEEYLRLLREAQKESNQSSARVSLASSRRDTPKDSFSPKSPPNSPNTEAVVEIEGTPLTDVYINYYNREGDFVRVEKNIETDWIWDWSSRPDQSPPKEWRFVHPGKGVRRGASIRRLMVGNSSLFSRDVLYTLLITNVLSLLLGTGIGIWLSKRSGGGTTPLSTIPIN